MPIEGKGWEFHMIRQAEQENLATRSKRRTVGRYQVFHDGKAQNGDLMAGMFAECKGPGDNNTEGNKRRVEAGRYSLHTQGGTKYATFGYAESESESKRPWPGIELKGCLPRTEILIHPGTGFLQSVGCINLCTSLPDKDELISFVGSRKRVIAVIENLRNYLGGDFPTVNERPVPRAFVVIDGEPTL